MNCYKSFNNIIDFENLIGGKLLRQIGSYNNLRNILFRAFNLRIKISKCKRCGDILAYRVSKTKHNHNLCQKCINTLNGKKQRNKQQKELKEKISKEEMDLFFNEFYPVIIKECELRGQKWEDSFHKYLLNIAWRIKDSGILIQKDRYKAVKLSMAYLAKAVKQKSKEVVFSDLTDYYNRTLGLDVFREE